MSVTQEEIKKISENLSKLSPKNLWNLTQSVDSILSYFELLNEVDTDWVIPTINVVQKESILRSDTENIHKDVSPEELLACSNQKVIAGQIAVNNIMK